MWSSGSPHPSRHESDGDEELQESPRSKQQPDDMATTNLVNQLVATDLARQDQKDKMRRGSKVGKVRPKAPPNVLSAEPEQKPVKPSFYNDGPQLAPALPAAATIPKPTTPKPSAHDQMVTEKRRIRQEDQARLGQRQQPRPRRLSVSKKKATAALQPDHQRIVKRTPRRGSVSDAKPAAARQPQTTPTKQLSSQQPNRRFSYETKQQPKAAPRRASLQQHPPGPTTTKQPVQPRRQTLPHRLPQQPPLLGPRSDDNDDDDAYELAMARSNLSPQERIKVDASIRSSLSSSNGGRRDPPRRYSSTVSSLTASPVSSTRRESFLLYPSSSLHLEPSEHAIEEETEETTTTMPERASLRVPGAFAVQGINGDEDSSMGTATDTETANPTFDAEVYQPVVVHGDVVQTDQELDPKQLRRLRMLRVVIACFAVGATAMVIATVLLMQQRTSGGEGLRIEGWKQVGEDVFGPINEPQTLFGSAVAVSGDGTILAVATPGIDRETELNVGEIYVLEESTNLAGTEWNVLQIFESPGPSSGAKISLSMASDAGLIVAGYPQLESGSVAVVYEETASGIWVDQTLLGESDDSWFGYSVSISPEGSLLVAGAPLRSTPFGESSGSVQLYSKDKETGSWVKQGDELSGLKSDGLFGWSVSLATAGSRPRVAVGAPGLDEQAGSVRVYDWTGSFWDQVGEDISGEYSLTRLGESVDLSRDGSVLAVGARGSPFETGRVRTFREVNGQWREDRREIRGSDVTEGFGSSVSLSDDGNLLAIGSPTSNFFGKESGGIRVYQYDIQSEAWSQQGSNLGGDSLVGFGSSIGVSSDGKRVVGGAPKTTYDSSVAQVGSVQVYESKEV